MKGILEFDLPEEREDFETAQHGWKYKCMIDDVWEKLFRPYHKHGYSNAEINELLEKEDCQKLLQHLEGLYREVKNSYED